MDEIEKERSEVPEPSPVTLRGVRYEAVPWGKARGLGQNGGYIGAYDNAGRELWLLKVYEVKYDGEMEDDKQDRFISDIAADGEDALLITDERGAEYRVDIAKRAVTPL